MNFKVLFVSACAGILLASSFAFSAQPNDSGMEKHHQKMMADLKLTADQETKIQALHKNMMETGKPLFEQMKGINDKVKAEMLKDQPSKQALDGYATQLADIQKQLMQKRYDHVLQVKTILTKEQFSKHMSMECMCEPYTGMCEGMGEGHQLHGMCVKKDEAKGDQGHGRCGGKTEEMPKK
jgi:Spy/CpxP family protein refolding chaperone